MVRWYLVMVQSAFEVKNSGSAVEIILSGPINEDFSFDPFNGVQAQKIIINLSGVTLMTSSGLRTWTQWMQILPKDSQLILRECPKIFIDQANIYHGLFPASTIVESFYVPYYNEVDGFDKRVLYRRGTEFNGWQIFHPKDVTCDRTGKQMVIDVNSSFFRFLKFQEKVSNP